MPADEGESTISYSVKEILDKIARNVEGIDTKLDHKAEKTEVIALQLRMQSAEMSIKQIENTVAHLGDLTLKLTERYENLSKESTASDAVSKYKRYFFSTFAAATLSFVFNAVLLLWHHTP